MRTLEVAVERFRESVRAFREVVQRLQEHPSDGQLVRAAGRVHREDGLQRRDLHLVHPHGARDRMGAHLGDEVGSPDDDAGLRPPSSLSAENVTRSAPSASASATDGSSGGMLCS